MSQSVTLKAKGLFTFPNPLSEVPDGALVIADNVVIDKESVVSPRRGLAVYGNTFGVGSSRTKQLIAYKDRLLRHFSTTIEYDSDGVGTFLPFTGSYSEPVAGTRIKSIEANGNLYFTTDAGVKKISITDPSQFAAGNITQAGGIKALDGVGVIDPTPGFFVQNSQVAYRIVWGIKDANDNVILGSPSAPIIVTNSQLGLMAQDFNTLVSDLSVAAAADPGDTLSDTTFVALKISDNASITQLYNQLKVLAYGVGNRLDSNLGEVAQIVSLNVIAGNLYTAAGTSDYFDIFDAFNGTQYRFWFQVGSSVIPNAPAGVSMQEVIIAAADTNAQVAQKLNNVFNNVLSSFSTVLAGNTITVTNTLPGPTNSPVSRVTDVTFTATVSTPGSGATYQNIPIPTTINDPATADQLLALQAYFDKIVGALNADPGISTLAKASIGGAFLESTQSVTTDITFTIPAGITTAHFYQVYRSALALSTGVETISNAVADDELNLVFEDNPTSGDLSAGSITYHDIVPEDFRQSGAYLYTNANSGQGIAQANEPPPVAKDITYFRTFTFYANTSSKQSLNLALLNGSSGLIGETFTITRGVSVNTYTFVASRAQAVTITAIAGNLFTNLGVSDYFDIYSANNAATYRVWFQRGASTAPSGVGVTLLEISITGAETASDTANKINLTLSAQSAFLCSVLTNVVTVTNQSEGNTHVPVDNVANGGFTITASISGSGEDATLKHVGVSSAATPGQQIDETARSLVRIINKNSSEVVYALYSSGISDVPGKFYLEAKQLGTPVFSVTASSILGPLFNPSLPLSGTSVSSNNQVNPNRLFYSKDSQPEAVPLVNYLDVGPKDKAIIRILPLRDSLFILTESGVYRLTGNTIDSFYLYPFDYSVLIKAPDSATVLNNQIYLFSDQGVVTVSDTGIDIISRPIENQLLPLTQYSHFVSGTFAFNYNSDRAYLVWTVTNSSDTEATQCFRYNIFTRTWVHWPISKTCGIVNPFNDKMYVGAGDINSIEQERKSYTRLDFADRSFDLSLPLSGISGTTLALGSLFTATTGDSLVQIQYLTLSQYNRLLKKLDTDTGLTYKLYYSTFKSIPGLDLRDALLALATQLDLEASLSGNNFYASIIGLTDSFPDQQSAFNIIVNKLNVSSGTHRKNYVLSQNTVQWEVPVVGTSGLTITLGYAAPLLPGLITLFKVIPSTIIWAPHHMGDPSQVKHVRDSTFLFNAMDFTNAVAAYSSDLSTGYQNIPFNAEGIGDWGSFDWGQVVWGGEETSRSFRTYIPSNKQRCRYINAKLAHGTAFEQYEVLGVSFTFEMIGARGYR